MKKEVNKFKENKSNFTLKYEGKNEIDVETLSSSINGVVKTIKNITSHEYPETYAKLKIINLGKGSFEITLSTIIFYAKELLLPMANMSLTVIAIYLAYIQIKQHLKGQQPKDVKYEKNTAKIINQDNGVIMVDAHTTNNYFSDSTIDASLAETYDVLSKDEDRTGLKIIQDGKTKIDISKDEFDNMSTIVIEREKNNKNSINTLDTVELKLKKPDLLGDSKWSFIFTKIIEAQIEDKEFVNKVHSGIIRNLYAGVKILVKLRIEQESDEKGLPIKDTDKYFVEKVIGDIIEPQDRQIKMF